MFLSSALIKATGTDGAAAPVYALDGTVASETTLPPVFKAPLRKDLVRRVYLHLRSHTFQPKGASKGSGHKHSVESWGVGFGMARISRVRGTGTAKYMAGGMVPSAVGGRPTHPPVVEKKIHKKVNVKERRLALLSAIAATASQADVLRRGHRLPAERSLPIVVVDDVESIRKTTELKNFLLSIGLGDELDRCHTVKVRAGKGKMRGRRYKKRVGPLIVVSNNRGVSKAANGITGVSVVEARNLSVLHLAPGGEPGRLTLYTTAALQTLGEKMP